MPYCGFQLALCRLAVAIGVLAFAPAAHATPASWREVTAVNREALLAAAKTHLDDNEVQLLIAAIDRDSSYRSRSAEEIKPPFVALKNGDFVTALVRIVKRAVTRGGQTGVEQFLAASNRGKLIRGYGRYYLGRSGYGGPSVIELTLIDGATDGLTLVVFYRLVQPRFVEGQERVGSRVVYPLKHL